MSCLILLDQSAHDLWCGKWGIKIREHYTEKKKCKNGRHAVQLCFFSFHNTLVPDTSCNMFFFCLFSSLDKTTCLHSWHLLWLLRLLFSQDCCWQTFAVPTFFFNKTYIFSLSLFVSLLRIYSPFFTSSF